MRSKLTIILTLAVVFLAVSSAVLVPPAASDDLEMTLTVDDGAVTMDYIVRDGQYDRSITAVALEVSRIHQGQIYVLINDGLEFKEKVSVQRLADHLNNELTLLGSDLTAKVIGIEYLPVVFSDYDATLIVGPGADLPGYYSYPALQWVTGGGLWIGIGSGSAPFMYSMDNAASPNATIRLDFLAMDYNGGEGISGTPMAQALGFRYVAPEYAFRLADLVAAGGRSIGYEFDRDGDILATVGVITMGEGSFLVLAGNMAPPPLATSEEVVAWDIMKIILLNVPWWSGNMKYETGSASMSDLMGTLIMDISGNDYVCCGLISNSDSFSGFKVEKVPVRAT